VGFSSVLGVFDICQSFRRAYSLPRNPRIRFHFWSFITDFILGKSAFVRKCARNRRCTTRRFHRFEVSTFEVFGSCGRDRNVRIPYHWSRFISRYFYAANRGYDCILTGLKRRQKKPFLLPSARTWTFPKLSHPFAYLGGPPDSAAVPGRMPNGSNSGNVSGAPSPHDRVGRFIELIKSAFIIQRSYW
jgi:hypothetical protein